MGAPATSGKSPIERNRATRASTGGDRRIQYSWTFGAIQEAFHVPSLTVENYIKAIFQVGSSSDGQAATGQLAQALGVSPRTVTSKLTTLSESNLVTYTPYEGVRLTAAGNALALRVVRRHRLIQ